MARPRPGLTTLAKNGMADKERLFSLDALRGFAILNMVVIHFVVYWSAPVGAGLWLQEALNHLTGADFGAALFLMLAGVGQALSLADRPQTARTLRRGACLFAIGLVMLGLAWGPADVWEWDILTLMATALGLSLLWRRLPSWLLLLLCLAVAGATPWLRRGLDFAHFWGGDLAQVPGLSDLFPGLYWDPPRRCISHWNLGDILRSYLLCGSFPLFPTIIHPMVGMVLGRLHLAGRLGPACPRLMAGGLGLLAVGLGLAVLASRRGGLSPVTDYLAPLSFFPASFTMVLMQAGAALTAIALIYYVYDHKQKRAQRPGFWGRCLLRAGQASLSLYFLHYLFIAWPLRLASWQSGRNLEGDFVSPWLALAVGLAVVLAWQPLLAWWFGRGLKYGLEWCLVAVGGKAAGGRLDQQAPLGRHT